MEVHSEMPLFLLMFSLVIVKVSPASELSFMKISSLPSGKTPCHAIYALLLSAATSTFNVFLSVRDSALKR